MLNEVFSVLLSYFSQVAALICLLTYSSPDDERVNSGTIVAAVLEFFSPGSGIMNRRTAFFGYTKQVERPEVVLGNRMPLRSTVQSRYILVDSTRQNCIGKRLRTEKQLRLSDRAESSKMAEIWLLCQGGKLGGFKPKPDRLTVTAIINHSFKSFSTRNNVAFKTSSVSLREFR